MPSKRIVTIEAMNTTLDNRKKQFELPDEILYIRTMNGQPPVFIPRWKKFIMNIRSLIRIILLPDYTTRKQ